MGINGSTIVTACGEATLMDNGIIYLKFSYAHYNDLEQVKRHIEQLRAFFGVVRRPYLSNIKVIKSVSKEILTYFSSTPVFEICSYNAIFVNSTISSMIGNVFISLYQPEYPNKVFSNYDSAVQWLEYKSKNTIL